MTALIKHSFEMTIDCLEVVDGAMTDAEPMQGGAVTLQNMPGEPQSGDISDAANLVGLLHRTSPPLPDLYSDANSPEIGTRYSDVSKNNPWIATIITAQVLREAYTSMQIRKDELTKRR